MPDTLATPPVGNGGGSMPPATGQANMAEDKRNPTHEVPVSKMCGDHDDLSEIAAILAGTLLRLWAEHAAGPKKREISRDNSLGCPAETRPPAVNL